ncbi:MAG: ROK family transcriptional regulator [Gemmatimonadota bacterium]|nr:ROK family transcriptional regulator [Gemmatimonadota bacterium]
MRSINRANVLNVIREKETISRVDISRLVGLKKPAVSSIVEELFDEGLICEDSVGESPVGRKPITLKINERSRIVGCIDANRYETTLAICDLGRNLLEKKVIDTVSGNGEDFFSECGRTLAEMARSYKEPIAGVGVSVPALVDHSRGAIYLAYTNEWKNVHVRRIIEEQVGCKVFVENDSKSGALAELWFAEEACDLSDFVFLWVCEGIGVGLVFNKALYHGTYSLAGEFGKQMISIDSKGDKMKPGTWEDKASDFGAVRLYSDYSGKNWARNMENVEQNMQRVIDLARKGDDQALRALKETALYLGVGIANINNGLNPERIIIGGKIVQAWDIVYPVIVHQLELLMPYQHVSVHEQVVPSSLSSPTFEGTQAMVHREVFKCFNMS